MTLAKGQKVSFTFYGNPETATIERVANGIVWLDNGRWMHAESVTPIAPIKPQHIETTWELRTYDVWGNAKDGYEVNDTFRAGEANIRCKVEVNNAGTAQEFLSAYPSDSQIRKALNLGRFKIETEGDDVSIAVNRARDGYPLGELFCTSHDSLSPIAQFAPIWEVIAGNVGTVYSGTDETIARAKFESYKEDSILGNGRVSNEDVTLMCNGEVEEEHIHNAVSCDQCEMLSINGIACHETGCPNMGARWDSESGEWIRQRKCFECGCTVDADSECCNGEEDNA
jgi:hypothetical protein